MSKTIKTVVNFVGIPAFTIFALSQKASSETLTEDINKFTNEVIPIVRQCHNIVNSANRKPNDLAIKSLASLCLHKNAEVQNCLSNVALASPYEDSVINTKRQYYCQFRWIRLRDAF